MTHTCCQHHYCCWICISTSWLTQEELHSLCRLSSPASIIGTPSTPFTRHQTAHMFSIAAGHHPSSHTHSSLFQTSMDGNTPFKGCLSISGRHQVTPRLFHSLLKLCRVHNFIHSCSWSLFTLLPSILHHLKPLWSPKALQMSRSQLHIFYTTAINFLNYLLYIHMCNGFQTHFTEILAFHTYFHCCQFLFCHWQHALCLPQSTPSTATTTGLTPPSQHCHFRLYACKLHQSLIPLELTEFEGVCCKVWYFSCNFYYFPWFTISLSIICY